MAIGKRWTAGLVAGALVILWCGCSKAPSEMHRLTSAQSQAELAETNAAEWQDKAAELERELAAVEAERAELQNELTSSANALAELQRIHQTTLERLSLAEETLAMYEQRLAQIPDLVRELQAYILRLQTLHDGESAASAGNGHPSAEKELSPPDRQRP